MCGLFGIVSYGHSNVEIITKMAKALGKASEIRGVDAGGFSYIDVNDGKMTIKRNKKAISMSGVFDEPITGRVLMGHTRFGTGASEKFNYNNHPFPSTKGTFTMAHNGIINNDYELEDELALPPTKVQTDSYIVVRMLDHLHEGKLNEETIKDVAERLEGTFTLSFQDKHSIWIAKHNNPIYILNIKELGMIVYASTDDILQTALDKFYDYDFIGYLMSRSGDAYSETISCISGDILHILQDGSMETFKFKPKPVTTHYYPPTKWSPTYSNFKSPYNDEEWYRDVNDDGNFDLFDTEYEKKMRAELDKQFPQIKQRSELVKAIYGAVNMPKTNRVLIHNGEEFELVNEPTETGRVYSIFLGKSIIVDKDSYDKGIYELSTHSPELFNQPYSRKEFAHYIIPETYSEFMKTVSKNIKLSNLFTVIKSHKVSTVKRKLKELVSIYTYLLWTFDLSLSKGDEAFAKLEAEFEKMLELALYHKGSVHSLYEYLQANLEYFLLYYLPYYKEFNEKEEPKVA